MNFINTLPDDFDFNEFARYDVENEDVRNLKEYNILTELRFKFTAQQFHDNFFHRRSGKSISYLFTVIIEKMKALEYHDEVSIIFNNTNQFRTFDNFFTEKLRNIYILDIDKDKLKVVIRNRKFERYRCFLTSQ